MSLNGEFDMALEIIDVEKISVSDEDILRVAELMIHPKIRELPKTLGSSSASLTCARKQGEANTELFTPLV